MTRFLARCRCLRFMPVLAVSLAGCSDDAPTKTSSNGNAQSADVPDRPAPPPLPDLPAASLRVYTTEPGYTVFVDGTQARTAGGAPAMTPCRVTSAPGLHTVTVVREGEPDRSRQVAFADDNEAIFDTDAAEAGESLLLAAAFHGLAVGQPVPLDTINTADRELDPYLSADGLSLWFAGERTEGRGIFVATRASTLDQFSSPKLLRMTRGGDLPATPSLTADESAIVYALPEKTRISAVTRSSPLVDFDERNTWYFDSNVSGDESWLSAQTLGDGLKIYFTREVGKRIETRVVSRASAGDPFGNVLIVDLPGLHPCLSSDGLRQYYFDGSRLFRARRTATNQPFSEPELVTTLDLEYFVLDPARRQIFVSDDEQWMVYCDDPSSGGDLQIVRLADGPGWGVAIAGEPIPERVVASTTPTPTPAPTTEPEPEPETTPLEPEDQSLPYARFRARFAEAIGRRDFAAATTLVEQAQADHLLENTRELLAWDRADVERLADLWEQAGAAAESLKPGDEYRVGSIRLEFVSYADGVLTGKARTRDITTKLVDFDASSLAELTERVADPSDVAWKLAVATLLAYDPQTPAFVLRRRLDDAGAEGLQLANQFAGRLLELARWELERDDFAGALTQVSRIESDFPQTEVLTKALELRNELYSRINWQQRGNRMWKTGPEGEYTADSARANNAVLMSPEMYERFELTMEYRTNDRNGQGGVFFRYPGSGDFYRRCFKIQLSNDRGVNADEYCTGALFGIEAPTQNAAGPEGEWNTFRMRVDGEDLSVWINDRLVLDTTAIDDQIPESGYVALDGSPGGISYRKILLTSPP